MGEKCPRILSNMPNSTLHLGIFTCRKTTTWDRRLYFPSEERRAEDFFVNPRTWVPKASTLPLDHRSRFAAKKSALEGVKKICWRGEGGIDADYLEDDTNS